MPTEPASARAAHVRHAPRLSEWAPLLLCLLLLAVTRTAVANHYVVPTGSMQPTLQPGDRVLVDMRAYGWRVPFTAIASDAAPTPRRGEVAVFRSPRDGTRLVKRVVAVGGDLVALRDGRLYIDGVPVALADGRERLAGREFALDLGDGGGPDIGWMRVPPGKLLVLGDHRGASADGRMFGLVDADAPYARALGVYWRRGEGPVWKRL